MINVEWWADTRAAMWAFVLIGVAIVFSELGWAMLAGGAYTAALANAGLFFLFGKGHRWQR